MFCLFPRQRLSSFFFWQQWIKVPVVHVQPTSICSQKQTHLHWCCCEWMNARMGQLRWNKQSKKWTSQEKDSSRPARDQQHNLNQTVEKCCRREEWMGNHVYLLTFTIDWLFTCIDRFGTYCFILNTLCGCYFPITAYHNNNWSSSSNSFSRHNFHCFFDLLTTFSFISMNSLLSSHGRGPLTLIQSSLWPSFSKSSTSCCSVTIGELSSGYSL